MHAEVLPREPIPGLKRDTEAEIEKGGSERAETQL
jgi:hypothetical protein